MNEAKIAKTAKDTTKVAVVEIGGEEYTATAADVVMPTKTIEAKAPLTVETVGPNTTKNAPVWQRYHDPETPPVIDTTKPIKYFNEFARWYTVAAGIQLQRPLAIFLADPKHAKTDKYEHARIGTAKMTNDASPYSVRVGNDWVISDSIFVNPAILGTGDDKTIDITADTVHEYLMHRINHLGNAAQNIKDVGSKGHHNKDWVASCTVKSGLESLEGNDKSLGRHETIIRPEFAEKIMAEFKPDFSAFNIIARYAQAATRQAAAEKNAQGHPSNRINLECPTCKRTAQAQAKPALFCGCKATPVRMVEKLSKANAKAKADLAAQEKAANKKGGKAK